MGLDVPGRCGWRKEGTYAVNVSNEHPPDSPLPARRFDRVARAPDRIHTIVTARSAFVAEPSSRGHRANKSGQTPKPWCASARRATRRGTRGPRRAAVSRSVHTKSLSREQSSSPSEIVGNVVGAGSSQPPDLAPSDDLAGHAVRKSWHRSLSVSRDVRPRTPSSGDPRSAPLRLKSQRRHRRAMLVYCIRCDLAVNRLAAQRPGRPGRSALSLGRPRGRGDLRKPILVGIRRL